VCRHRQSIGLRYLNAIPYHSWERGLNENHKGLLRQYFPKNQPPDHVTLDDANKTLAGLKTIDLAHI
jgi:IS30 family transposase